MSMERGHFSNKMEENDTKYWTEAVPFSDHMKTVLNFGGTLVVEGQGDAINQYPLPVFAPEPRLKS